MTDLLPRLVTEEATKIVLILIDGLGGVRTDERGSELHAARTPNMDRLAREGSSGLHTVIAPGVTSGSGAGHLAVFGYDPLVHELGRGALSAAGVGFPLKPGDVAARVNFCTLDAHGVIADRRAGRIPTDENARLCVKVLAGLVPPAGVEVFLETEREHRALLVLRGEGLSPYLLDTDPQVTGLPPRPPTATVPEAVETAARLSDILAQVAVALQGEKANFLLLRGFDTLRELPLFPARYQLRAQGIAIYPMYTGIARILGMDVTTVVARTATSTARSPPSRRSTPPSPTSRPSTPTSSASPATTQRRASSAPTRGTRYPSCCGGRGWASTGSRSSTRRRPGPAATGPSWART